MEDWKETELGIIPADWKQNILSKYAEKPQYGFTDSSSVSGNAKFLRITDITDTGVNWNDVPYCNCPDINKYKLIDGDIVFARIGATTGKSYIINNPPNAVFASYLIRVRTNSQLLSIFLIYFFKSEYYWKQINSQKGNNLKGGVNGSILSSLKIIIPPLPEQRKIAYILSTVQKAIEQQDKLIRHTTELKKALMQKLFTEGTKNEKQKQTEIGLVPESWEVVELGEICEKPQYGFTDSASAHGNARFLRITDITEFGVNWDGVPFCNCADFLKYELKNGDIVFARIGATTGKSYLINNPPKSVYASYLIRIRCKEEILPEFLIYYFASEKYWKQIDSTKGNNLKGGVNGSILSKLLTPKPILKEQKKIAETFKTIDAKLKFCLLKKQTLSALFKTLLHELMTGQRRVHEIELGGLSGAEVPSREYKMEEQPLSVAAEK